MRLSIRCPDVDRFQEARSLVEEFGTLAAASEAFRTMTASGLEDAAVAQLRALGCEVHPEIPSQAG